MRFFFCFIFSLLSPFLSFLSISIQSSPALSFCSTFSLCNRSSSVPCHGQPVWESERQLNLLVSGSVARSPLSNKCQSERLKQINETLLYESFFFSFLITFVKDKLTEFNSSARCSETDDCLIYAWPPCCCSAFRWTSSQNNTFSRPHSPFEKSGSATVIRLAVRLHILTKYGSRQVGLWPEYSVKQHLFTLLVSCCCTCHKMPPALNCRSWGWTATGPRTRMWRKSR